MKPVAPIIPYKGRVAFVGNRPTEKEVAYGQVHHGRTQEIIHKSGLQSGLNRFAPFGHHLAYNKFKSGQPTTKQVDEQRDRLIEELSEYKPVVIFALGSAPFYALTGDEKTKVSKVTGKRFTSKLLDWEHYIIPIPHPASLVYRPQDYREYMQILTQAVPLLEGKDTVEVPKSKYIVIEDSKHLVKFVQHFLSIDPIVHGRYVSADTETDGLSPIDNKMLCLGMNFNSNGTIVIPDFLLYSCPEEVNTLLVHPEREYIWHNGKFDINFLREAGIDARVDHDTILLEYLLDETSKSLSLKKLAARYLGADSYQDKIKGYLRKDELEQGFENVPTDVLYEYLGQDCLYTRRIFDVLYPTVMKDRDLKKAYHMLMIPGSDFLSDVERTGIAVNKQRLQESKKELQSTTRRLLYQLEAVANPVWDPKVYVQDTGAKKEPKKFNPGSPKQMKWLLYEALQIKHDRRSRLEYNARKETIEAIKDTIDSRLPGFADKYLEYKKLKKLLSTYVIGSEKKIRSDGRVNGSYKLSGTATGRLSVDLLQQVPPVARRFYVPPKGRIFLEVDYSGAELRVLAALSGDRVMKQIFIERRDLHSEVAAELFNIEPGTETREQRLVAKTINFGIMYGRQAPSLAKAFGISVSEAQQYINRWFARFPDAHAFLNEARGSVKDPGFLVSPYGRKRRFPVIASGNISGFENEACNFRMQSTASDCTLRSGIVLNKRLRPHDIYILNLVHDSILFEAPDTPEALDAGTRLITDVMTNLPQEELETDVKFEIEMKVGYSWGEMKEIQVPA